MPPFLLLLAVHIVSLVTGMGAVLVIDVFGLLWMLKRVPLALVVRVADVTQRLIWLGWFGLVASGIGLIMIKGSVDNLFLIKLYFVLLVGANGIFMHTIKRALQAAQGETLPAGVVGRIALASTISQVGWWGAITIGFLHNNWRGVINWPPHPAGLMVALTALILLAAFIVETSFRGATQKN